MAVAELKRASPKRRFFEERELRDVLWREQNLKLVFLFLFILFYFILFLFFKVQI